MSFVILVVLHTLDATFLHLGVAAYVGVRKPPALDKENFNSKQQDGYSHQNQCQKSIFTTLFLKKHANLKNVSDKLPII